MIKVLVIDDSPLIRGILTEVLQQAADIRVVGCAEDPYQARELIKTLHPDVLTLDIEMPKMDGLSFLRNLMRLRPMPVVMISTLTQQGSPATLEALEIGAVDFIAKPKVNVSEQLQAYADTLQEKVRVAAQARIRPFKASDHIPPTIIGESQQYKVNAILAIGASTGGTEAIKEVLMKLPKHAPATVITQHIPPVFSASFAQRMDRCTSVLVKEAEHGDVLGPGKVFIAPGDKHLKIVKRGSVTVCELYDGDPVNRHKPAVDVLFDSLIPLAKQVSAVLLTGMGSDGAKGMLKLRQNGAKTAAQDEASCVVWGMPRAAVQLEAAQTVIPLSRVAQTLLSSVTK
ncbi:chemotaxis response regulator protein-glutamate methylesterase [Pseudoalteromonas sp. MMG013]|uniref:Protein-glutamate methylesterase/protein-glutamine glutaminase n=1 Tax=Pseudoalteromonas aurantia 208 TaxID=1314867 RepID=A0ABR9E6M5_9GAMM|nr:MULTISPECIES: chemotaxis response regulator protein-glutamate methylesterase [Pseudoalteromonas]MBE0366606.1 two-component system, chemotaxis family, response regulator CheB [Pseudoalteromonas aurantia 208]MBQ4863822.1 chemotaxis response regulator protein-glutamate methylesterase [Pseudoalteromonas sp. MMG013]